MSGSSDVVVIGGAAVGSAVACFLTEHGFSGSVTVIEKDPTYTHCCTTLSLGGIRQQFSTPENIRLSQFGIRLLRSLQEKHGPTADVGFHEQGYLILASDAGLPVLEENVKLQRAMGADIELLDPPALNRTFGWLSTEGLAAGAFGRTGEGWVDPWAWMNRMKAIARTAGVTFRTGEVTAIGRDGNRVTSVTLADGTTIPCGIVVNAAGTSGGKVARLAGLELPVGPRKRYVYVLDLRDCPEELHKAPLTVDTSGVYFRPEGRQFLTGLSPNEDEEPPPTDFEVDYSWFEERLWPLLAARVPRFEAVRVTRAWAGHYDYNDLDQNGVIGPHPDVTNFYFANGFSGHGLQQAPATGNAVAEHIVHGRYRSIDVSRLGFERIAAGKPLPEVNVI
ncbi:MAG: FAD-binding oxidoreductase [Hyphomicrobiales bacterium]